MNYMYIDFDSPIQTENLAIVFTAIIQVNRVWWLLC